MGESDSSVLIMTAGIALQTAGERLKDNFFEAILYPFTSTLGEPLLALLIFGTIGLAYYQVQRSVIIPVIMLILVGGVTLSRAPSSAGNAIVAMSVLALASMGYIIYTRARER
jgi:hypothetical protein